MEAIVSDRNIDELAPAVSFTVKKSVHESVKDTPCNSDLDEKGKYTAFISGGE